LTSVLRRAPPLQAFRYAPGRGLEGDVCVFALAADASPILVEAVSGRAMTLVPGDVFLGTPGNRESTRWVVGGIPAGGLVPGRTYWVLAESGIVGDLAGDSPLEKTHLERARYLGSVRDDAGRTLNIRQFAARADAGASDRRAPVSLIVGTSAEIGKTTAAIALLRSLLRKRQRAVIVLKATGTGSLTEIDNYRDHGARQVFDCVDFGLPTTYPSKRKGIERWFGLALDTCLSLPADAVLIECGGDLLGANVPVFLKALTRRRARPKVILAAADALGALSAKQMLEKMGLPVGLITGPCTDTPTLQQRTQKLCRTPALNLAAPDASADSLL